MPQKTKPCVFQSCRLLTAALAAALTTLTAGAQTHDASASPAGGAQALQAKYLEITPRLEKNQYQRPLLIESTESAEAVSGNAYAVLDAPFSSVSAALKNPTHWCEVMILHINTKYCRATSEASPTTLKVNIGKKTPQDLSDAFALDFSFRQAAVTPDFLAVQLNADKGPMGTSRYRIELHAAPLPGNKTFMHLTYSYGFGLAGKLAMQGYLSTVGSGKVGFTQLPGGTKSGSATAYVGGMRAAVERNTMRYYLAIDAYLASLRQSPGQQLDARLNQWFNATEQFALQLREVDRASYLDMKKSEYARQQAGPAR